ncbi:MAG: gamma carbonic anhydrase family protein [Oscillospiraceae bacterium]|nr:gamma carbonic anhydrase family protein [Oscillospiraceae bacterium]
MIKDFKGIYPKIHKTAKIAENAVIIGKTEIGANTSVWYNAVIRADLASVSIGDNSNFQDNCTVHSGLESPVKIGSGVTVGHNAIIHGCTVGDNCILGMGCVIMNGAVIGTGSVVGAGALVTENKVFPPYSIIVGSPAKVLKTYEGKDAETLLEKIKANADEYIELADQLPQFQD